MAAKVCRYSDPKMSLKSQKKSTNQGLAVFKRSNYRNYKAALRQTNQNKGCFLIKVKVDTSTASLKKILELIQLSHYKTYQIRIPSSSSKISIQR